MWCGLPTRNEPHLSRVAELGLECTPEAFGLRLPKFLHLNEPLALERTEMSVFIPPVGCDDRAGCLAENWGVEVWRFQKLADLGRIHWVTF